MSKLRWLWNVLWHFLFLEPWRSARAVASKSMESALLSTFMAGMAGGSVLGFALIVVATSLLGFDQHLFPGLASQERQSHPTLSTRYTFPNIREKHSLIHGHRCADDHLFSVYPAMGACVNSQGTPVTLRAPTGNWTLECCSAVVSNSDKETLAAIRIIQPNSFAGRVALFGAYSIGFGITVGALVGGPLMLLIAGRLVLLTPVRQVARFLDTFSRGVHNAFRVMQAPPLIAADFRGQGIGCPVVCQLTDLHLVAEHEIPEELKADPQSWLVSKWGVITGGSILARTIQSLSFARGLSPSAILVTGDLTDMGSEAQWDVWEKIVVETGPWSSRTQLLAVPGNHDLTFNPPSTPDPACSLYDERKHRFDYVTVATSDLGSTPFEYAARVLRKLPRAFPEVIAIPLKHKELNGIHIVLLNSNMYPSQHSMSGAIGEFGRPQLEGMASRLKEIRGPLIIATHHHLGILTGEGLGRGESVQDRLMLTLDGDALLKMLRDYAKAKKGNNVLVLHGHRHRLTLTTDVTGVIKILGLPSSTLGMHKHEGGRAIIDGEPRVAAVYLTDSLNWEVAIHTLTP